MTTCTTNASFPFGLWYIIDNDYIYSFAFQEYYQGRYFFPGPKHIPVSIKISAHSVTESKTHHLGIGFTTATSFCHMTLSGADLSEMRPVHAITSIMCNLKRPLRYGGYLSNRVQQNNFEMCIVFKGNALQCVDGEIAFARSALEFSDTICQKHQLHCHHSVTIS